MKDKYRRIKRNDAECVLKCFDKAFDDYNAKKITKDYMLECCKMLYVKLPVSFVFGKESIINKER